MGSETTSWVIALGGAGLIAGLLLLVRGMGAYRSATLVADTSNSPIESLAAGEVRVSGVVEEAEMTLVSLLQSTSCVYYRATIEHLGERTPTQHDVSEERAIGFRIRDASGSLRVFPREGRFDVPARFDASTGLFGDEPNGLELRTGASTKAADPDRASAVAELLTVKGVDDDGSRPDAAGGRGRRHYKESRLEIGDPVTVIGRAMPFSDLADPTEADLADGFGIGPDDPEVAADLEAARATGALADDPTSAWGNAAIPGFGIGRPISAPTLDPSADALPIATADEAARAERTFDIAPETLVLAASRDVPLRVAFGTPGVVVARGQSAFLVGLLGAVVAIASAMILAITVDGGFGR